MTPDPVKSFANTIKGSNDIDPVTTPQYPTYLLYDPAILDKML